MEKKIIKIKGNARFAVILCKRAQKINAKNMATGDLRTIHGLNFWSITTFLKNICTATRVVGCEDGDLKTLIAVGRKYKLEGRGCFFSLNFYICDNYTNVSSQL